MLSFVSARTGLSTDDLDEDDLDARPPSVDEDDEPALERVGNSGSFSGSGTDSDLEEFFDAVAGADEGVSLRRHSPVDGCPHLSGGWTLRTWGPSAPVFSFRKVS